MASLFAASGAAELQHVPAVRALAAVGQLTGLAHAAALLAGPLVGVLAARVDLVGEKRLENVVHQIGGRRFAPGVGTLL